MPLLTASILIGASFSAPASAAEELRIGFDRAEDRHFRAARHRHAKRLPDVSGRAQGRARRRQGDLDRRGRPGQAGHRRHQGQQAHPVGQGAHAGRRRAGDDRLCARAGRDPREDALHRLDRDRRRPRPARLRKISLHGASDLRAVAAEPSARAMGLRARLQADQPHRRRLCLRPRDCRRLPEGVRGLRRQDRAENLAADRHQGFRPVHPDDQGRHRRHLRVDGGANVPAIPQATARRRLQEADPRRRHQL